MSEIDSTDLRSDLRSHRTNPRMDLSVITATSTITTITGDGVQDTTTNNDDNNNHSNEADGDGRRGSLCDGGGREGAAAAVIPATTTDAAAASAVVVDTMRMNPPLVRNVRTTTSPSGSPSEWFPF